MRRLSALRLFLFVLCLVGAQHAVLVHAFEHIPGYGGASVADTGQGEGGHALVCADCLSAHTLAAVFHGATPAGIHIGLGHVLCAPALLPARDSRAPEPRAHGPPPVLPT